MSLLYACIIGRWGGFSNTSDIDSAHHRVDCQEALYSFKKMGLYLSLKHTAYEQKVPHKSNLNKLKI